LTLQKRTQFNPIDATEQVQKIYLDYFKSTFAPNNKSLQRKFELLKEKEFLWKPSYISISQNYKEGKTTNEFCKIHNISQNVADSVGIDRLYEHQELAIENIISNGHHTVLSSGTGSGKTETFLIPLLSGCNNTEEKGVKAIIIYPMNALANNQVDRIRRILFKLNQSRRSMRNRDITFGIYTGQTPDSVHNERQEKNEKFATLQLVNEKCPSCYQYTLHAESEGNNSYLTCRQEPDLKIYYQLLTREEIRNNPPDILITNYMQLEYLLLRKKDSSIFQNNKVKYLVVDELHAYGGAKGIDVALLIRRLKRRLKDSNSNYNLICIGTSATISKAPTDQERKKDISDFSSELFGEKLLPKDVFEGMRKEWIFDKNGYIPNSLPSINVERDISDLSDVEFANLCADVFPETTKTDLNNSQYISKLKPNRRKYLGGLLLKNKFFQLLLNVLKEPNNITGIIQLIEKDKDFSGLCKNMQSSDLEDKIWSFLKLGTMCSHPNSSENEYLPLIKVSIHNFFRNISPTSMCFKCGKLYPIPRDQCDDRNCFGPVDSLGVCRFCGTEFMIFPVESKNLYEFVNKKSKDVLEERLGEESAPITLRRLSYAVSKNASKAKIWHTYASEFSDDEDDSVEMKKCLKCGSLVPSQYEKCNAPSGDSKDSACNYTELRPVRVFPRVTTHNSFTTHTTQPHDCPSCGNSYGQYSALSEMWISPKSTSSVFFNLVYIHLSIKKMLIFTDSRQFASLLAGNMDDTFTDYAIKTLIVKAIHKVAQSDRNYIYADYLVDGILSIIRNDWHRGRLGEFERSALRKKAVLELSSSVNVRSSLENLGLVECNYQPIHDTVSLRENWKLFHERLQYRSIDIQFENSPDLMQQSKMDFGTVIQIDNEEHCKLYRNYIVTVLNIMRRDSAMDPLNEREYFERDKAIGYILDKSGRNIPSSKVVELKNFINKRSRLYLFTTNVFSDLIKDKASTPDEEDRIIESILAITWEFLKDSVLIREAPLGKGQSDRVNGYVVTFSNMIFSQPNKFSSCSKCKRMYLITANNCCTTWRRGKLCDGEIKELTTDEFEKSKNDFYWSLYGSTLPYRMITKEDTGAISTQDRQKIEAEFIPDDPHQRKVDVIVATPTLELGVDIGDLSCVGLYKAPPSPVSYLQRVGRAGRRDGISFINTFLFSSPIDEYYFRYPDEIIKGLVNPPFLNFSNRTMIEKHINALIIEEIMVSLGMEEEGKIPSKVTEFINTKEKNFLKVLLDSADSQLPIITRKVNDAFGDLGHQIDPYMIPKDFKNAVTKSIEIFKNDYVRTKEQINELNTSTVQDPSYSSKIRDLSNYLKDLSDKVLIQHFMDTGVLPHYAFPGRYVEINNIRGEKFEGRTRSIALSEFAPTTEAVINKKVFKSIGVDIDTQKTINTYYICSACNKYISDKPWDERYQSCVICYSQMAPRKIRSVAPNKIFIDHARKPLREFGFEYREPKLEVYLPSPDTLGSDIVRLPSYEIHLKRYGNVRTIQMVSKIMTVRDNNPIQGIDETEEELYENSEINSDSGSELKFCTNCGKVQEKLSEFKHYRISNTSKRVQCSGRFESIAIHHVMPTFVISLRIKGLEFIRNPIFLTTLKNAIIFAGEIIAEAEEGEIEGEVKGDEILLYDNVEGGVGYVEIIYHRIYEVLKRAAKIILHEPDPSCECGCMHCLWSYRRKRDIPSINKKYIIPLLLDVEQHLGNRIMISNVKDKIGSEQFFDKAQKIVSPANSIDGLVTLKDSIRNAKEQVSIAVGSVTGGILDWPGEGEKSWIDILISLRSGERSIQTSIVTRFPETKEERTSIRRLLDAGLKVSAYPPELEKSNDSLFELMKYVSLVCVDPMSKGKAFHLNNTSLSDIMWKKELILYQTDYDLSVKNIYDIIESLEKRSSSLSISDLPIGEASQEMIIHPDDYQSCANAAQSVYNDIKEAKQDIIIFDPHLKSKGIETLDWHLNNIVGKVNPSVRISIISANHAHNEVYNSLKKYNRDIRFLSFNSRDGNTKPLHERWLITDGKKFIKIGKGLRFLFEFEMHQQMKDGTSITISREPSDINNYEEEFNDYWNFEKSENRSLSYYSKVDFRHGIRQTS
jgi:ATP-dependent helicase YprA (DUF1998 family)